MNQVKVSAIINKSAQEVFNFTINPDNTSEWVEGVVKEETNEAPTKLGTIYRNQGKDGSWAEFEITAFEQDKMFELTKKDDNHHVKYTFKSINEDQCELEYVVWVEEGEVGERFSKDSIKTILNELKEFVENKAG